MTSAAISLLSTAIAPAAQAPSAADSSSATAKANSASFASTLEKAGKAQDGKSPEIQSVKPSIAKSEKEASSPSSKQASAAAAVLPLSNQSGSPAKTESTVQIPEDVTSIDRAVPQTGQIIQDVAAANTPLKAADNVHPEAKTTTPAADKPIKDEDAVSTAADPASAALPTPVIDPVATAIPNQAQTRVQPASTESLTAEKPEENMLGSSILASISMRKSLDKPAATGDRTLPADVSKLNAAVSAAISAPSQVASGDTKLTAELSTALPAKAATAEGVNIGSSVAAASSSVATQVVAQIKPQVSDGAADNQPSDSGLRADSVSATNALAAGTALTPAQHVASPSSLATVLAPVNSPDWAKSVGQQLVNFHLKGEQDVQLHLNPSNLGPMSITLNVDEHLQATAHFSSHSGQVRSAIEQGIGQLRDAMAQQGITLGQTSVGDQRQQGFSQSNQPPQPRYIINQLTGASILATDSIQGATTAPVGTGEISTYA